MLKKKWNKKRKPLDSGMIITTVLKSRVAKEQSYSVKPSHLR